MSWLDQIMSSDIVYRIGWAIIHSTWQGLAIAAVFGLALVLTPRRMSRLRYGCGCLALLAMLGAFCATGWIAGPRPNAITAQNPWRAAAPPQVQPSQIDNEMAMTLPAPAIDSTPTAQPAPAQTLAAQPEPQPWAHRLTRAVSPWTEYICGAWVVGVFAMSIWNLGGWIAVRRLRMIGTWPPPEQLVGLLDELRGHFSIRRTVKLLQSTVVKVPMTIGWLKPVVLIPASILAELSPQHIEAIIAHELAHVRRCDYLVNLLQTVVETLFFHHPAVWWISHRVRLEREYCCDNAVVKLTADQVNYAKALAEIAERKDNLPQVAVAADGGSLVDRIRRILGLERESSLLRNRSAGWAIVALVFIAAAFAVGIGLSSDTLWAAPYKYGADADDGTYQTFQKMLGTWHVNAEKSTGAGSVKRIEIKPDATCIRHESVEGDPNPKTFYDHIRLKDNGLIVSGYWGKQTFALTLEDNTMTWTEGDTRFTFERATRTLPAKETVTHPIVGKWKCTDAPKPNPAQVEVLVLEFNADGTGRSTEIGPDGKTVHSEQIVYRIEDDTILGKGPDPDDKWEPIQWRVQGGLLYLTDDDKVYQFTRIDEPEPSESADSVGAREQAGLKEQDPAVSLLAGTWVVSDDKQKLNYLIVIKPDGRVLSTKSHEPRELPDLRVLDGLVVLNDGLGDYAVQAQGDTLLGNTLSGGKPWPMTVRRFQPDPKLVGSWSATNLAEWRYQVRAVFLDLREDATFTFLLEGQPSSGIPERGYYLADGNTIQFFSSDLAAFSSVRYHEGTLRMALADGTAVLKKESSDLFAGPEHPMFRAELTSHEWPNGQTWLDLDTGRIIGRDEYATADTSAYELTILGNCRLLLHSTPGRILPLHDAGMNFNRAGACAVKYLASLHQSKLTQYDYKEGLVAAVLTDRGNLAVIHMTRTGSDQTPVAWSLASITETADGPPRIEAIGLAATARAGEYVVQPGDTLHGICIKIFGPVEGVRQETHEALMALNGLASANQLRVGQVLNIPTAAPARSVTLPDLDEQPAFVDLATGDMVVMPEGIEKDDEALRTHLTQLSNGDLGFDKQLVVLRGGSACLWDGVNSTAMASTVHEPFNIRAYDLANIPCRLLVTTGDGKQFDVSVLEKTADGGLKIEYRPLGTKVTTPAADSAAVINAVDRTLAAKLLAELSRTRMCISMYRLDNGKWPDLGNGWAPLTESTGHGRYIKAAPVNAFTDGSAIAADASGDWQYDPAAGTLKGVVPLTTEDARKLNLDTENDVVCAAGGEVPTGSVAEVRPPTRASERVRYALDKIAYLVRYIEREKDGDIAALSGYFDQINEFCDGLQGKNGPAPGRDEWGGLDDARIEAILKMLSDIEQTAEGCRELSRGGHKELLDQHWQLLKHEYGRLCTVISQ